jgi:hypothetical protein
MQFTGANCSSRVSRASEVIVVVLYARMQAVYSGGKFTDLVFSLNENVQQGYKQSFNNGA